MKLLKKIIILTLFTALFFPFYGTNQPLVLAEANLDINAKSAILVDASSGKILYSLNPDQTLAPASMTKMMSEYLILEAIDLGKINWEDIVSASEYAHWMGVNGGSRVYLGLGEKHTVRELMEAMAIYSANDATVALAEFLAGSEANFVDQMNNKAQEFGMLNSYFVTSTGFPADELEEFSPAASGDNLMTARDTAILAWHLVNDYPEVFTFTSTPFLDFSPTLRNLPNWNRMIPGIVKALEYPGVDGLKTGFTEEAGYNFTGTATKNGFRLITVVFNTSSEDQRFIETKKLLDYGFNNYEMITVIEAKEPVLGSETVQVEKGKETEVKAVAKNSLHVLAKKGEENLYEPVVIVNEANIAPIKVQDKLGKITSEYSGDTSDAYLNEEIKNRADVDLIAGDEVEKAGALRLFFRKIILFFKQIFESIVNLF